MLALEPPYPVLDGYALLPDHADPLLWYAVPSAPRLAVRDGAPALHLTLYANAAAGAGRASGGILQLVTELVVPDEALADLGVRLARVRGIASTPRVVPVSFDTGAVELAVLGRTAAPPPQGSAAPGGLFQVDFVAGGRPSLTGTNDAVFQLVLNESAAEAIERCLDQGAEPIVVTYVMSFAALRPAFTIDISADWTKVYSSLQSKLTANAWFAAADVDVAIRNTLEESGIRVDTVVEGTGEGAQAAAARTREKLLDWVLDKLFEPMGPPVTPAAQIGQVIEDSVWSLARAIIPGASYRLRALNESQLRRMDIRARERVAEQREVRPQGTLDQLLRSLRWTAQGADSPEWPGIRERMLSRVELSGFPRLEVTVGVVDRFAADGLRSVDVELARAPAQGLDPEPATVTALTFTSAAGSRPWVVNLLDEAAREQVWQRPYVYRVVARFDPASPLRPGEVAASPWSDRRSADLLVEPREAYAVTDVSVTTAPLFSFTLFPVVVVELRAGVADAGTPATAQVTLDAEHPLAHWSFTSDPGDTTFSWRPTYHRPAEAGGPVTLPWRSGAEPFVSLADPMPEKLTVAFFVDLPWPELTLAMLELRYEDPEHDVRYAPETVMLDASTTHLVRTYSIAAGGSRELAYRLTLQRAVGGLVDGSWRVATDDRVIVDRRLVQERAVRVRVLGTLADRRLLRASLHLEVRDSTDGRARASQDLTVTPGMEGAPQPDFTYLVGDPPVRQVWWQLQAIDANGFPVVQPWGSGIADLIVVDLRSLSVTG